jgi:hypothetical protein
MLSTSSRQGDENYLRSIDALVKQRTPNLTFLSLPSPPKTVPPSFMKA